MLLSMVLLLAGCSRSTAEEDVAAAREALAKGDRSASVVRLKNALQKNANLVDARLLLARTLYEAGNVPSAEVELDKAAKLGLSETAVAPLRARLMLARGENAKLIEQFADKKLAGTTEQVDLMTTVAIARGRQNQNLPALQTVNEALKLDPSSRRAQLVRIRALRAQEGAESAMRELEGYIARDGNDAEAWMIKGEILAAQAKNDESIAAYRHSLSLRKKNWLAQGAVISLLLDKNDLVGAAAQLKELQSVDPKSLQVEFFAAALALQRNELKEANEHIQRVLKVASGDEQVLQLAANIELRRGALLEAEVHLGKLLLAYPDNAKARLLQAQLDLRMGDAAKAEAVLQPLLDLPTPPTDALRLAAEIEVTRGDTKAADGYLGGIIKRKPGDVSARVALAQSAIRDGKVERGIGELRAIAASDRGVQAEMALIKVFALQRNYDQVLELVAAVERKVPGNAAVQTLRGRIDVNRGQFDKARQDFNAALKIDEHYYPALAALVALDVAAGKPQLSLARLQAFVKANPKHVRAQMTLLALNEKNGGKPEETAQGLRTLISQMPSEMEPRLALIESLVGRKEDKQALAAAQEAVAAVPDSPELRMALGQVQAANGAYDQAIATFNEGIGLRPKQAAYYMPLAEFYASRKDSEAAVRVLNRALSVQPDFLPAQTALMQIADAKGNKAEALKMAKQIQSQQPQSALGWILAGDSEASAKSWDAAAQNYRVALSKGGGGIVAVKLDIALLEGRRDAESSKFEAEWLAAHAQDEAFLTHLGSLAMSGKKFALAEERYRALMKLNPDSPVVLNNLAWVLGQERKPGALELAEKANALAPNQPSYMDTLAEIYAQSGQMAKAIDLQKKVLALTPENHPSRLNLARYYLSAGQKDAAREELKRLAALGDKLAQQEEVQKLLGTL
ncbi:MAG: PEP-CTERM system TPR-repeat protein PrsT [Paucibacter sp.]|nr:PEP-CTERM system TPR-repeat protein PrsT [Roseateles sp.]